MTDRILPYSTIEELWHTYDDFEDFALAIEQDVLHSPEIQALRKDAERYRWLRDCSADEYLRLRNTLGLLIDGRELDEAIDHARGVEGGE